MQLRIAMGASAGSMSIGDLAQLAASGANQYVRGVAAIVGEEVSRKQIKLMPALLAIENFDP